jgi:periplasmic protein CpxP/Spy
MTGNKTTRSAARPLMQRSTRWVVAATFMALTSAVALSAWAQPMSGGMMGEGGRHGAMMGGHGGGHGGMMSGRGLDHLLDGLNASDAQRTQIKQIAQAAAADMHKQHEAGRALREKSLTIFGAPTVDAAAAESLRQQMQALHDQGSRRMLQAMLDASKVLTPEQRAKLAERMKQRQAQMQERMQRMDRERPR